MLRPPEPDDTAALIGLRDEQFHRFMGPGSPEPQPVFCVLVDGDVVGWVDHERGHDFLAPGEHNVGWAIHPAHRGRGYVTRAVRLLVSSMQGLTAVAIIEPDNTSSRAVATRAGFTDLGVQQLLDKPNHRFERPAPPRACTDGVVTIRPPHVDDTERHTEAADDVQIDWLWEPWQRADWEAKSPAEQLDHQRRFLQRTADEWGSGPQWWFAVEVDGRYVGHVDTNLANPHVPHGEANISYSIHPDERGKGYASRAARLAIEFTREHTGAREAHVLVHPDNEASLRVARALGAREVERTADGMVRHVLSITR